MKSLSIFIHIPILIILILWLKSKVKDQACGNYFMLLLTIKLLSGLTIMWIFVKAYDYPTDIIYYHADSRKLFYLFCENPMNYFNALFSHQPDLNLHYVNDPRALFFVKLISPLEIICLVNGWLVGVYLTLLSFVSSWYLFQKLTTYFSSLKWSFLIALMIFPSVIFWSSGVLKETVVVPCMFYIIALVLDIRFAGSVRWFRFLLAIPCLLIVLILKYYVFAVFIPILLTYLLTERIFNKKRQATRLFYGLIALVGMIGLSMFIHPNLHPNSILTATLKNHDLSVLASAPGAFVDFGVNASSDIVEILAILPKALVVGLYGPIVGVGNGGIGVFAGIENGLLLLVSVISLFATFKYKIRIQNEVVYILLYSFVLAILLTIASPNYGSLVRYKVMFMPLFLIVLFYPFQIFLQNTVFRKK